jgi:type II secretory pathway pseudopilin PulG
MVVVAIIVLLLAVLLPALGKARASAKRTACAAHLKDIGVALRVYINANRDRLPHVTKMPSMANLVPSDHKPRSIVDVLNDEIENPEVFHCPADVSGISRTAPNDGLSYFESEGTSYEFRSELNGTLMKDVAKRISERRDIVVADNMVWIMRDFWNFHDPKSPPPSRESSAEPYKPIQGARRYLFIDGHVGDFETW